MTRSVVFVLPLLALTQCTPPPPPTGQAKADAETLAACRQHADAVYNRQYRDQIYTITNTNVPYSTGYAPGVTDRGLARQHGERLRAQHRHRDRPRQFLSARADSNPLINPRQPLSPLARCLPGADAERR
jgi:hypothetical protein